MILNEALAALNENQNKAVKTLHNAVVTAGAGSGKTTVLAYRYAHLVIEEGFNVDEILTLTFTNKATNEMYERIYKTLSENSSNPRAKKAIDDFYKANIQTLDSFCAKVARSGAALFGIAPDFVSDDAALNELAKEAALSFVLDNRGNKALQTIISDKKIKSLAENLFAGAALNYSPITAPLNFSAMYDEQLRIIANDYDALTGEFEAAAKRKKPAAEAPPIRSALYAENKDTAKAELAEYANYLQTFRGEKETRNKIIQIVNYALHSDIIKEIFSLLEKFQNEFNYKKRASGLLTFNDIARLAVDTLLQYPDIRLAYKQQIKAIMVDEFQDNNSLQKELIFLLAEDEARMEKGLPVRNELSLDKLFFVGDEKQSIYRFRGADVSVFRALNEQLPEDAAKTNSQDHTIQLDTNYRSRRELIEAFNVIFEKVFISGSAENYEAEFKELRYARLSDSPQKKFITFLFLNADDTPADASDGITKYDLEAAAIAQKIVELVSADSGRTILKKAKEDGKTKDVEAPCTYGDIAILVRKKTHQNEIEKQLKNFGIPYNAEEPGSLFNDPFINDTTAYLRLLAYPRDKLSYTAVLRSPFARLSDLGIAVIVLKFNKLPFDKQVVELLSKDDAEKYKKAASYYKALYDAVQNGALNIAELITKLWYDAGYRFEALVNAHSKNASEVYDYLFELACRADANGKTLAQFLAYIEDLQKSGFQEGSKKIDNLDIPIERSAGVRILTIHKSKGLEFPVVFMYGCADSERAQSNRGAFYFAQDTKTKQGLLTLNLPHAKELNGDKPDNYFYSKYKDEEKKMSAAELRRLLYVASTRAESALFWTGTIPASIKEERESNNYADELNPILKRIKGYYDKICKREGSPSFFNFVVPALAEENSAFWDIEQIPYMTRDALQKHAAALSLAAAPAAQKNPPLRDISRAKEVYAKTVIEAPPLPAASYKNASNAEETAAQEPREKQQISSIKKHGISAADFGTIVHSIIEDRFKGIHAQPPEKGIIKKAHLLADNFFNSALGKKSLAAEFRKIEYPFISLIEEGGKKVYINGKIDLLFKYDNELYIVDYKTDKKINPELHTAQLRIYRDAVQNLFLQEKCVKAYLFYLRDGAEILVS